MHPLFKKLLSLIAIIYLLLFIVHRALYPTVDFWDRLASRLLYPFTWTAQTITSFATSIANGKESYNQLHEKYTKMQQQNDDLLDEVIKLRATSQHYAALKELAEFQQRYNLNTALIAKVLIKHIASDQHYLLVNRGLSDGVVKNMIALYQNHLVGRVCEVYPWYSKITLITDQHCKVAAYTGSTQATGIVQGCNCIDHCTLSYVSHLCSVKDDDLVLSSGQGLVFPEGFCIGKIAFHALKEKTLYHYIEIKPLINVEAITYCLLLKHPAMKEPAERKEA